MLWVMAGVVGLFTVAPGIDRAVSTSEIEAADGYAIPRAPDGQFYVAAQAGEAEVRFLVDAGTDGVLLSGDDAKRLKLDAGSAAHVVPILKVGPQELRNVPVRIAPNLPVSLLGRAFLARFASAEVRRDQLVLR